MKIKVEPSFYITWLIFLILGKTATVFTVFICGIIHEAGHICAYSVSGISEAEIRITACGISADFKGRTAVSYKQEILCFLAGGIANLLSAPLFLCIRSALPYTDGGYGLWLCSLVLGGLNLLPIYPLDGGRVVFCALASRLPLYKAKRITNIISVILIIPLAGVGIYALWVTGFNVSLLLICAYLITYILSGKF